ncbi:hypothetical protein FA09DRAFT_329812 [Tilletiopsis washingtonensis]|jgi:GH43 family beta-xylosidase|uniref:Uncharacterized protein n=1 Tax=Tilletiopsis washingtonensis TaxID=58919 RepID=A0A316Z9D4_9BASI|nr:hypothetical protein FA09DRAFT_329812 [Tilletiopsis washingtonensis]PWN98191.1 hypothetical protein FA09DRAFT_329812 [Tilletiopsis washingtonensis]
MRATLASTICLALLAAALGPVQAASSSHITIGHAASLPGSSSLGHDALRVRHARLARVRRSPDLTAEIQRLGSHLVPLLQGSTPAASGEVAPQQKQSARPNASQKLRTMPDGDSVQVNNATRARRAASVPAGIQNTLSLGQDPSILRVDRKAGKPVYIYADSDFERAALIRVDTDLNEVNRSPPRVAAQWKKTIGTQAPDIARWDDSTIIYSVSSTKDDMLRTAVSDSATGAYRKQGTIKYNGTAVKGFDSHIFRHPNGKRYLAWSDHQSILLAEMRNYTALATAPVAIVAFDDADARPFSFFNTEAPSTIVLRNKKTRGQTLNLAFATGDFRSADYSTRTIYIDAAADPLVRRNWTLNRQAMLQTDRAKSVYGPGSGAFFRAPDDRWAFAYGAWHTEAGQGTDVAPTGQRRTIRVQHVAYDEQGVLLPLEPAAAPVLV